LILIEGGFRHRKSLFPRGTAAQKASLDIFAGVILKGEGNKAGEQKREIRTRSLEELSFPGRPGGRMMRFKSYLQVPIGMFTPLETGRKL